MPYTVKLKNQAGIDVNYSDIEIATIPLASGSGNAAFVARYGVTKLAAANITYNGGDYAAHSVGYICLITTGATGKHVPDKVTIKIGDRVATENLAYTYAKLTDTHAVIKVVGDYITGNIEITAVAVTPSA